MGEQKTSEAATEVVETHLHTEPIGASVAGAPGGDSLNAVLRLQRQAGNRAVRELLRAGQAKLEVGAADDSYEREADSVAQAVVARLRDEEGDEAEVGFDRVDASSVSVARASEVGAEGGEVSNETEAAISAARGGGAPLDGRTRGSFENAFGTDFGHVRLHSGPDASALNERLQAKAFTVGNDIFFRGGLPDTTTTEGQSLLAHELTHTVQQGGGSRAASRVRRLMTEDQFKEKTPGKFRSRSGVAAIDKELATCRSIKGLELQAKAPDGVLQRQASLQKLKQLCAGYEGNRAGGVGELAEQVKNELTVFDSYAKAAVLLSGAKKIPSVEVGHQAARDIFEAQDAWIRLQAQDLVGPDSDVFSGMWGAFQSALGEHRKAVAALLIEDDLRKLEEIANADTTDPLVAAMLKEALRNKDKVMYAETGGMASNARIIGERDKPEEQKSGKKYLLETQMAQNAGSAERESTLMHELIHISVQERFENTAVHLAIEKGMEKSKIKQLSEKRTQQINTLDGLKGNLKGVLGDSQYKMFDGDAGKILYCVKGKNTLASYAERLGKQKRITETEREFILELEKDGCNNTLAEFDTSISQMAYVLDRWGVPKDNKFRQKLDEIAQEAYEYRGSLGGEL